MNGALSIGVAILLIAVAGVAAAVFLRPRLLRGRAGASSEFPPVVGEGRLTVLESTPVDGSRRLVLLRCDDVEHLILVGGPADMVVDKDVNRGRAAMALAPSDNAERARKRVEPMAPPQEPQRNKDAPPPGEQRPAAAAPAAALAPAAQSKPTAAAKPPEPKRLQPPLSETPERPPRPNLTAVPPAQAPGKPAQNGAAAPPARPGAESRPAKPRPQPVEPQFGRREPTAPAAPPQKAPVEVAPATAKPAANAPQPAQPAPAAPRDTATTAEKRSPPKPVAAPVTLPVAETPWPQADRPDAESAPPTRSGPGRATPPAGPKPAPGPAVPGPALAQPPASKPANDAATTLGDLAQRLEEALAREVQSAHQGRSRTDVEVDAFQFDTGTASADAGRQKPKPEQAGRQQPKETDAKPPIRSPGAAPDSESRRDARTQAERPEEAPVISLSARRREAVDPLEDEMARLLGELTGDTNRR